MHHLQNGPEIKIFLPAAGLKLNPVLRVSAIDTDSLRGHHSSPGNGGIVDDPYISITCAGEISDAEFYIGLQPKPLISGEPVHRLLVHQQRDVHV